MTKTHARALELAQIAEAGGVPTLPPDTRQMRRINVRDLVVDSRFQRALAHDERVDRMAHQWDWNLSEAATVVPIGDGKYRVTEGQRRVTALSRRDPDASMWALVLAVEHVGVKDEARIGMSISTGRTPFAAFDKFEARVRCGEPHEVQAQRVLDELGLRLGRAPSSKTVAAAASIMSLIHGSLAPPDLGAEWLRDTLMVLMTAWPNDDDKSKVSRFDHRLFDVIGQIVSRNDDIDLDRLAHKLSSKAAARWVTDCTASGAAVRLQLRVAVLESYNKGLRVRRAQ